MANVLLISYDNDSHIPFFPLNIWYLASALKRDGHNIGVWGQDIHHGSEEALTKILDENPFDVVGLGFCAGYYQFKKGVKISEAVNKSKRRKDFNFVLGGHGPAAAPDYFLDRLGADTIVVGDGEGPIREVAKNNTKGVIQGNPCKDSPNLKILPDLFPVQIYRLIRWPNSSRQDFCFPILTSRGCKWHCSFCYRMRDGFYMVPVGEIIEQIKHLHNDWQITHFQFADELLMASEERTAEICEAILRLPFKIKWDCNGRLNYASREALWLMKKSGCCYINYGIESLNQGILNSMGKGLTLEKIHQGIQNTLSLGLTPGLNLLWGFPGDTEESLKEEIKFLLKYDPCDELRTIRPVTPYPGTPLFKQAIAKGLIEDVEDFYERKHKNSDLLTANFTVYTTENAHKLLMYANETLVKNYLHKRGLAMMHEAEGMYLHGKAFRGFRAV